MRFASLLFVALVFAACGPKKMPQGPAPEYEEPPVPSWFDAAAPDTAAPPDAGTPEDASE